MTKFLSSLQTKLTIAFILLILVISGMTFFYTYSKTKQALLDSTRDDMLQIVGIISTQFTPQEVEQIASMQPGQETSPEFLALKAKMQNLRSLSPNIINLYTMKLEPDNTITFLVDDLDEDPATIGQQYEEPEQRLYEAVNGPKVSDDIYTDEWGTFLSGYAPLKDSTGKTVVLLGADMQATKVKERQDFIGNTIYFIVGISIIIAAVIVGLFSMTIIKDIKKLNEAANKISTGDPNVVVDVKRKDEVGDLAESFGRMVASLKIMMTPAEQEPATSKATKTDEKKLSKK